jgi:hypothetical protein
MNRFPQLVTRLARAHGVGQDIIRTHQALHNAQSHWDIDGLHRIQERRIDEFDKHMVSAINDWNRDDLNKYWTGYS